MNIFKRKSKISDAPLYEPPKNSTKSKRSKSIMIKINADSYCPIAGDSRKLFLYAIKYSIGEFEKIFTAESHKPKLTFDEVNEIILEHEKNDNILNCACGVNSDRETSDSTNSEEKEVSTSDLLSKLLNNPRVESISISIERVGDAEETCINAKLKEIEWLYMDTSKIDDEEMKKIEEALKNIPPSTINIFNGGGYQPSGHTDEELKPPSTGSGIN